MKLLRSIAEMTGPIPYELTLAEIIKGGDALNPYHIVVLALLSDYFKSGLRYVNGQVPISSGATSVAVIESIKSLSPSDKVNLAQYLLDCINAGYSALHNPLLSSTDWIRFVLHKQ